MSNSVSSPHWVLYPLEREKGRVFYAFFKRQDEEDQGFLEMLSLLQERFNATIVAVRPGPYNSHIELAIRNVVIDLVDDNWPCPYFSAPEADTHALALLVTDLRRELDAAELARKPTPCPTTEP